MSTAQNLRIVFPVRNLDDRGRSQVVSAITAMAPQSAHYDKAIRATVGDLGQIEAELVSANDTVANLEGQLALARDARDAKRMKLDKGLVFLRGLVQNAVNTVEEARTLGFDAQVGRGPSAPLSAPEGVDIRPNKRMRRVVVGAKSASRGNFGAQLTTDPTGVAGWQDLPGAGRTRKLEGYAPGTTLWVRFRALRRHLQSDWCAPVAVTIP